VLGERCDLPERGVFFLYGHAFKGDFNIHKNNIKQKQKIENAKNQKTKK
jgi:hypothetical protein